MAEKTAAAIKRLEHVERTSDIAVLTAVRVFNELRGGRTHNPIKF
jgi:hypothetical protein